MNNKQKNTKVSIQFTLKMKRTVLITIALIAVFNLGAQVNTHKLDYKFGAGLGFMGSGDVMAQSFENELTYKLNSYFSTSISLGLGRTFKDVQSHNDYMSGSLNLFISPFKNNRRNNFKIGAGYTLINETASYSSYDINYSEGTYNPNFNYLTQMVNGFSMILEDEYMIGSRFLLGGKIFVTGGVEEGGIVSGGMIKVGILL